MPTWQQIRKGTRARRRVQLLLSEGPLPVQLGDGGRLQIAPPDAGSLVQIDLRPLTSGEQTEVLARARADAVAKGVPDPKADNPIYGLCEQEHTLLLCCVDPDSPENAPRPLFASIDEIRGDPQLGQDRIAYLFELWQRYQDECSPRYRRMALDEILATMLLLAGEEEDEARRFFESLGPALQWTCTRTLAVQWRISSTARSLSGSLSASKDSGSASSNLAAPAPAPAPADG